MFHFIDINALFIIQRVGSNELMGCSCLGPTQLGPGRDHWYEMLENSRKPVAQWYLLQESLPCLPRPVSTTKIKQSSLKATTSAHQKY